jgi:DNA-damage-inducible protein D
MNDTANEDQQSPAPSHISPFERIRQVEAEREFWAARDLAEVLGYTQWRNFEQAIGRAIRACRTSGQNPDDHFAETSKMVAIGSGARRNVKDYQLSRYACYLIIQNADPDKEIVALGQTYFAVQTRKQEIADAELLEGVDEDQRRLYLRGQLADHNRQLSEAANQAGVITAQDFAIFHDHGYMGLYGGLRTQDIHRRKGLKKGQQVLDYNDQLVLAMRPIGSRVALIVSGRQYYVLGAIPFKYHARHHPRKGHEYTNTAASRHSCIRAIIRGRQATTVI